MDYKALYRKWRPKVFEEVLGQEHVTSTLRNQILNDNVAHAYLFSGIRGTGKTSTAKIFARALNCTNSDDGNPCNTCDNCLSALADNAIDIIEIDAASNNGVDDIRDLREKTKYPPSNMKYKVYIIDEVHMLSIGAFNALLKTLEEPPSYIVFIFATTEIHKIPATIISRCQKYELKRVMQSDLQGLMANICEKTGFTFDDSALEQIARMADGAARDSLSILDQCLAANDEKHISSEVISNVLGLVTEEKIYQLIEAINNNLSKDVLTILNEIISSGKDIKRFINQLIEYFRYLMLAKVSTDLSSLINVSAETLENVISQAKDTSLNLIIRGINILTKVEVDSKWSSNSRVILEIGLIKILQPDLESSIESLTERIEKLEKQPVQKIISTGAKKEEEVVIKQQTIVTSVSSEPAPSKQPVAATRKPVKEPEPTVEIEEKSYDSADNLTISSEDQEDLWEDVLEKVRERRISTHALLLDGKFEGFRNNCLCISYGDGYGFHLIAIDRKDNREIVENAIAEVYGAQIKIKYVTQSEIGYEKEEAEPDLSHEDEIKKFVGNHQNKLEFID